MNKMLLYCVSVLLPSTLSIRNRFDFCIFCETFKYIMQLYLYNFSIEYRPQISISDNVEEENE